MGDVYTRCHAHFCTRCAFQRYPYVWSTQPQSVSHSWAREQCHALRESMRHKPLDARPESVKSCHQKFRGLSPELQTVHGLAGAHDTATIAFYKLQITKVFFICICHQEVATSLQQLLSLAKYLLLYHKTGNACNSQDVAQVVVSWLHSFAAHSHLW